MSVREDAPHRDEPNVTRPAVRGDLHARVALVTGAGGGIGGAVSRRLAAIGYFVYLVGRSLGSLEQTAQACARGRARSRPADLAADHDVEVLARDVEVERGRLDVLVHCAGTLDQGPIDATDVAVLDEQYRVNVRAFYTLTQRLLPLLRAAEGEIVVVNSSVVVGRRGGASPYAATKHALLSLTDTLRQEVNAGGVRVLTVFPGRTATALQEKVFASEGQVYRPELLLQPDDVAAMIVASIQLPRTAEVTDIHLRPMRKSYR